MYSPVDCRSESVNFTVEYSEMKSDNKKHLQIELYLLFYLSYFTLHMIILMFETLIHIDSKCIHLIMMDYESLSIGSL